MDFLFNFSFTRPDEHDAHLYEVGMHVEAADRATAERKLRVQNDHLTLREVRLFAVLDEDGNKLDEFGNPLEERCRDCGGQKPVGQSCGCFDNGCQ